MPFLQRPAQSLPTQEDSSMILDEFSRFRQNLRQQYLSGQNVPRNPSPPMTRLVSGPSPPPSRPSFRNGQPSLKTSLLRPVQQTTRASVYEPQENLRLNSRLPRVQLDHQQVHRHILELQQYLVELSDKELGGLPARTLEELGRLQNILAFRRHGLKSARE